MALVNADRVKETSSTTGTDAYSLAGATSAAFLTFVAGVGDGNTCWYTAYEEGVGFEVGLGTVTDGTPDTLARTAILASTNGGAAVSWGAGTRTIFCGLPAAGMNGLYIPLSAPSSLVLKQSAWGDVVKSWSISGSAIGRKWEVQADFGSGMVTIGYARDEARFDFPVEDSIPLVGNLTTWDGTTTYGFDWRVREVHPSLVSVGPWSSTFTSAATVDDSFVTDYILGFGHSHIDAHFSTDESWSSGASRDLVSFATLRAKYAHEKGLRLVAVSPINASSPGSSIEKQAQGDVSDTNYWYDLNTPADGPLLTALAALVSGKTDKIKAGLLAAGGPDILAIITPDGAASPEPTFERMEEATLAVLAAVRTIVGDPKLPIYFQMASRLWVIDADPPEIVMGGEYHEWIAREENITFADKYTGIGCPSPGESIDDFIQDEGTGEPAIHLTPAVCHRIAGQIGEVMARGYSLERVPQYRGDTYQLREGKDLDEVKATGFYNVLDPTNGPGVGFAWYLQVERWDQEQSNSIRQLLKSGSDGWWQRSNIEGSWEPWVMIAGAQMAAYPPGHIYGLGMSNAADTDHDITIAAGSVRDETDTENIVLPSAITKQIDATWAVGTNAGGINTGSVANTTWYEVLLIKRSDTGVVDVMFSTTANRDTLPTDYDFKRRIGWVRSNGSANLLQFSQTGPNFTWITQVNDHSITPTTTAAQIALTVPPNTRARFRASCQCTALNAGAVTVIVFSEIVEGNVTPAITTGIASLVMGEGDATASANDSANAGHFELGVNDSSQIEWDAVIGAGSAGEVFDISTYGWYDDRGREG